jgi:hypothetical protein
MAPTEFDSMQMSEARRIVDDALEEATERVAKKLASQGRVSLAGVDGDEAVCASVVGNDDCGQPSPVSVLDCPFEEDESRSQQGNLHESTLGESSFLFLKLVLSRALQRYLLYSPALGTH